MKTSQSFPFYHADFLIGTALMTCEQVGAYIRLLCHQWEQGPLPEDCKTIARIAQTSDDVAQSILHKFTGRSRGKIYNRKLEEVRKSLNLYRQSRSENGKKGGRPKKHMVSVCFPGAKAYEKPPIPSPIPIPIPNNTPLPPRGKFAPVVPDGIETKAAAALADWAKHRQDKKKPITPLQWDRLVTEAKTQGPIFVRKVEYSIAQGYQGLFEPSPSTNGHAATQPPESHGLRQANVFDRNAPKPA